MWSDASERYKTEIANIFSAQNKLDLQLKVEVALAKTHAELNIITMDEALMIEEGSKKVLLSRVVEIEAEIHHDLMSMVKALTEQSGEAGGKVHLGATSNDIQDTVLALQLIESKKIITKLVNKLAFLLYNKASNYKKVKCIGRTHGQFAVATTVGFKFANFCYELILAYQNLENTRINFAKFSGAVGNYASNPREDIEVHLHKILDVETVPISTQVISRVIHAEFLQSLALIGSVIERISKEIRNLQRSEIGEWFEPFSSKQVGSSAMPHKRNPHKSERISGLVRIIRSNVSVANENIALEHEREITHSSVERVIIPESLNLLVYVIKQMINIIDGLEINLENVNSNLEKAMDRSISEQLLLQLVDKVGRQEGHEMLKKHIHAKSFRNSILNDTEIVSVIGLEKINNVFNHIEIGLSELKVDKILKLSRSIFNFEKLI